MQGAFSLGTLHVVTESIGASGETIRSSVDHTCEGFVSDWDARTMASRGYPANTSKILIVQSDTLPEPKLNDDDTMTRPLNVTAHRYRITDVSSDPADATWQVAGVLV